MVHYQVVVAPNAILRAHLIDRYLPNDVFDCNPNIIFSIVSNAEDFQFFRFYSIVKINASIVLIHPNEKFVECNCYVNKVLSVVYKSVDPKDKFN